MLIRSQCKGILLTAMVVCLSDTGGGGNELVVARTCEYDADQGWILGKYITKKAAQAALDEIWENARLGKATDLSRAAGE